MGITEFWDISQCFSEPKQPIYSHKENMFTWRSRLCLNTKVPFPQPGWAFRMVRFPSPSLGDILMEAWVMSSSACIPPVRSEMECPSHQRTPLIWQEDRAARQKKNRVMLHKGGGGFILCNCSPHLWGWISFWHFTQDFTTTLLLLI